VVDVVIPTGQTREFYAQRDLAKARLTYKGMASDVAERWLHSWERASNLDAERLSPTFWDRAYEWASSASGADHKPTTIDR
jgi:hypothetical protein